MRLSRLAFTTLLLVALVQFVTAAPTVSKPHAAPDAPPVNAKLCGGTATIDAPTVGPIAKGATVVSTTYANAAIGETLRCKITDVTTPRAIVISTQDTTLIGVNGQVFYPAVNLAASRTYKIDVFYPNQPTWGFDTVIISTGP